MKKLSFSLKKIKKFQFPHQELVFWAVGFFLVITVFTNGVILPSARRIAQLKQQLTLIKNRYDGLSREGGGSHEALLIALRQELSELEGNLSENGKGSEILTSFLKKANELGITVIGVRPEPSGVYPDAANPITLDGKICKALSFQMDLRCSYRTLGAYLEALEKNVPFTFTVDGLEIEKRKIGDVVSDLKVTLFVTTYLFGTAP